VYAALLGTVQQVGLATVIAVPIGILTAIYLVEFGRGRFAKAVTFFVDVMNGVPSIVAGLFVFSVLLLGFGMRPFGAAGSPLPTEGFSWIYEKVKPDALLNVGSGGTDVCSGFISAYPITPVYAGEMTGCVLGVDVKAYDLDGNPVVGELGEMVVRTPMPSMPVCFWNDPGDERYHGTYFDMYPGVWRHGDWLMFTERGTCVITGRSDATLNRGGVRLGTGELYAVVEDIPEILDSLIVHLEDPEGGAGELVLFVQLREGVVLDDDLRTRVGRALKDSLSPRHVPDTMEAVPGIPRTLTGKKLELPVKRILQGADRDDVVRRDALSDPKSIDAFVDYAGSRTPA